MSRKMFEGINIVEFAWVGVGPQSSKYLADHGATIARIESHTHFDLLRGTSPFPNNRPSLNGSMFYGKYNSNKYGASLDLNHPRGPELAWRFIKWADILLESFRPGTMDRWGLDYDSVAKVKPDIIYLSTSMQGNYGPAAKYGGVGSMIGAVAGFGEISGWPDRMPSPPYGAYSDYFCQRFNSASLIAALDYRERTGKGQWIEQSQLETSIHMLAPIVMDYLVNGRVAGRNGNRISYAAPHGVYPCQGNDRWIAITVFNDEQWQSFCQAVGSPSRAEEPRFSTLLERKRNEDELDNLISEWTSSNTAEQIETLLQSGGVPAHVVEKNSDLFMDPQLKHRKFFTWLDHPEIGKPAYQHQPDYIASKAPREITRRSPCLGEDNEYVYKELLGMTDDEIAEHIIDGSITTSLPPDFQFASNI